MTPVLLDQGLPRSTAEYLRRAGWDAVHVGEIGMSRASDMEILAFARLEQRVCITLDADFHTLLVVHAQQKPSVVRIRIEGLTGRQLAEMLLRIWPRIEEAVAQGAMVTVTRNNIRVRHLTV